MTEKIEIIFNDKPLQVAAGARLIDVCGQHGVEIPRFCYHPGLSVVASCRMCQVEIEGPGKMPRRLAVSCRTDCQAGMKVWTHSEPAKVTRKSVLEFLLKNHPLDCPICDKAGECPLQNYTYQEGQGASVTHEPRREFRKRVDLGDVILLDEERCVLCTRCVRFCDEVEKKPELIVRQRGVDAMVGTLHDQPLHGNYQGNLADICPVGALTLKKFRFKARVWNLKSASSVCTRCSRGCNITVETHRGKVVRIRPRTNMEVNGYWMCDIGRFAFDDLNEPNRLTRVLVHDAEKFVDPGWEAGLDQVAQKLAQADSLLMLASPYLTIEEGQRFLELAASLETQAYVLIPTAKEPDHLLYTGELGPNVKGLVDAGCKALAAANFPAQISKSSVIYLAGEHIWDFLTSAQNQLNQMHDIILQDYKLYEHPAIKAYIAAANWAEKAGSFMNVDHQVQRIKPGKKMPYGVRLDSDTFDALRRRVETGFELESEINS